MTILDLFRRFW